MDVHANAKNSYIRLTEILVTKPSLVTRPPLGFREAAVDREAQRADARNAA